MKVNITPHPTRAGFYYLEFRPDGYKGKRERIPVEGYENACTQRDAIEARYNIAPERRQHIEPRLSDIVDEYLSWVESYKAKATADNKRCRLTKHIIPALGKYRVKHLSQTILDIYGKGMSRGSYRDDIYHLLALISWMVKRQYATPLTWKPEIPEYSAPVKSIPAPVDILAFVENIYRGDQKTLFAMMLYTGLRWNEATHLRWEDYQGDSIILRKTKRKIQKRIFIPEDLQPWFAANKKPEGWVFSYTGKAPYRNLDRTLEKAQEKTGIKMTPHLFRHASATYLYQITRDLYAVKNHLNQSRITTTEIYTRYSVEESREAVKSIAVHMDKFKKPAKPALAED